MTNPRTNPSDMPSASIPARPLFVRAIGWPVVTGVLWCGLSMLLGAEDSVIWSGVFGPGVVLVLSVIALALFNPSKQRPLNVLPFMWMGTSFARTVLSLVSVFLLYSAATPVSQQRMLFVAAGGALAAVLVSETRVYVRSLPRSATASSSSTSVES